MQTLVLIQIVTSLFERIELLLGLPKDFRISRRRADQNGLLSTPSHIHVVRFVLGKENDGTQPNGKGGIKALRKHIARAKQLLRERIPP